MSKKDIELALEALSKRVGVAGLSFDQSGTAVLAFGEEQEMILVHIPESDQLQIWCPLIDLSLSGNTEADCAVMQSLLERNFPLSEKIGAFFAVDAEIGVTLLGCRVTIGKQNYDSFVEAVIAFAEKVLVVIATTANEMAKAIATPGVPDVITGDTSILKA